MKYQGFTLIEIVVSIAIISILSGFVLNNYTNTKEQRSLESEAKKLQEVMYLASKKASAGETGPLSACSDFKGYQVAVSPATKQYTLRRCCDGACGGQSVTQQTYYLPTSSFVFSTPSSNTTYLFKTLSQPVLINPAANKIVTLKNTVINKCIPLTISDIGNIQAGAKVSC